MLDEPTPVERHFIEAVWEVKELEKGKPASTRKRRKDNGGMGQRALKNARDHIDGKDL